MSTNMKTTLNTESDTRFSSFLRFSLLISSAISTASCKHRARGHRHVPDTHVLQSKHPQTDRAHAHVMMGVLSARKHNAAAPPGRAPSSVAAGALSR